MDVRLIAAAAAAVAALLLTAAAPQSPTAAAEGAAPPAAQPAAPAPSPTTAAPSSIAASPAPAPGGRSLDKADLEAWLDGVVPYGLKSGDIAGAVVVVVKDGAVLLEKGYGYADVAKKTPMDPRQTLVRPGSTSKLFTWTAVMQLVEQRKLSLDRDVNDYLDFKVPRKGDRPITLRDLMNHRGGFEEGLKDVLSMDPRGLQSTEQYLKRHPRPLLYPAGEVPAYSNYGTALAGYIVERVSGEPFERYVERHILNPLGMSDTTFDQPLPERFHARLAKGYGTASGPAQPYELIVTRPAGSVTTTGDDMARFMIAHLQAGRLGDRQILRPETAQVMYRPSVADRLPGFDTLAHGFFHGTRNGRTVIGHGGDTVYFHTEMDLLPQEGVGIFYTFNSRGKNGAVYALRQSLFDGFMDRYYPAPPAAAPPALASARQDAREIAGVYQSSRRVEHGFLSLFYILQQSTITANPDGTISAPDMFGAGQVKYREVGPQIWREVGGHRQLALRTIGGVKTVIESGDPTSVLQAVPPLRSSSLNLTVLLGSAAILAWTLVLWALSPLLRRGERAQTGLSPQARRLRLYLRAGALIGIAYLVAWYLMLQPVMNTQLQVYSGALDPIVRTLQLSGLLVIAVAIVGVWCVFKLVRTDATWLSRLWSLVVAAALVGVVWIGFMGGLIGFSLNY